MTLLEQPPLPRNPTSRLLTARNQVREIIEEWSTNFAQAVTIGHAGPVTPEYLISQSGQAPRSIVTVISGEGSRIAGGSMLALTCRFIWFLIVDGTLEDRADLGLILSGEGVRLVVSSPWSEIEGSAFATDPSRFSFRSLYHDRDERSGLSIWAIEWEQDVDMGTATRPDVEPPEQLETLEGEYVYPGQPNDETSELTVPGEDP